MKDKLEMVLFSILRGIILIFPMAIRYKIAEFFGVVFYWCIKKRRVLTLNNIRLAFPELSEMEVITLAKKAYKNISKTFFEILWAEELFKSIKIENLELLRELFGQNKGIVMVSLHLDNWEVGGASIARAGFPVNPVAKRQRNEQFNKMINKIRESSGLKMIQAGKSSAKDLLRALKSKEILGLIADQYSEDIQVDFFGRKTGAYAGPAALALKFDSPVVLAYSIRNENNTHTVFIEEIRMKKTDDEKKDIEENTQIYIKAIENVIRKYPEQWFWQHRRWRDR